MAKKEYIIPIFIPFLGCPHDCAFCNQVKITNFKDKLDKDKLIEEIEKNLSYFPEKRADELAFFGGSFTGLDEDVMIAYLDVAKSYKDKGIIDRIRLSTRPDYINNSILDILKEKSVDVIELGIQSLDQKVLDYNERGHKIEDSYKASELIKEYGFSLGHQIMPGLFMDEYKKSIKTAIDSANIGPDMVRIYPTLVIKDTKLEALYNLEVYKPLDLDEAVELSAELYIIYRAKYIDVIRIGLQTTENINEGVDVVAGPFHPAIRQLTESLVYRKYLEELIERENIDRDFTIHTDNRSISIISGNKKSNKKYFYQKYGINLSFEADKSDFISLEDRKIKLDLDGFIYSYVKETYGGDLILD
ncbi:Oxygen-independent coproporphyrinogen-III oxidase 2 [Anaerococcus prevotii]|uniref:Radical SAM domain protein n=1 Tax=Anaerococcus prevotii (strain ATCC 9321 / DSM 20548 / JCM 6508 / NCTC 11806 / PC1) TaxID=525919 RepID=C7RGT8_ANAPD|nr:radical SAM protein [Anaerococcus prevotii]ACV28699.1 Radical SAM domain protein [Anaerococcus prevotii DSM 20548]SUU94262.1 Oxygen-independent coproporphyrinogen-III oxidase 2 [Anaerococcus prevotii]